MSTADDLLNSLDESNPILYAAGYKKESHIAIGSDRFITVPDSLKRIAVQYDHDMETVTFDCPRYWDDTDMSEMRVYINYMRPNGTKGSYIPNEVTIDTLDSDIMHFDWTISGHVTEYKGNLTFLVCVKKTDENGEIVNHWNSELNHDLYISEGMETEETVINNYPDIINQLLERQDAVEEIATPEAMQQYANTWLNKEGEMILFNVKNAGTNATKDIESKRSTSLSDIQSARTEAIEAINKDYNTLANSAKDFVLMEDTSNGRNYKLQVTDGKLVLAEDEQTLANNAKDYVLMKDTSTGSNYKLQVTDSKLVITEV